MSPTHLRIAAVVAGGLLLAGWLVKDLPAVRHVLDALPAGSTAAFGGPALKTPEQAGLRKCVTGSRVVYSDEACPAGSREEAIRGGNVSVVTLPRPVPDAASAAGSAPRLMKPLDREALDRERERVIEGAMKR
jgi:hypothetical protein